MIGFLAWVEVNKKRLLLGSAAAVGVFLVAFLFIQHQVQKEVSASEALSEVRLPFSAAAPVLPGTVEALMKVAEEHKGTKAAGRALLLSASLLFAEHTDKSYAEAQKRFTQMLQEYPNSPWTAEANLGLAASLAAMGKTNEAVLKYEEIRKRFATSPIIDEAKLALARLYEAQKPEDALRLYDDLAKAAGPGAPGGMGSGSAMEANMRMEELVKRRPELAKLKESLNPPATPPPAPPPSATPRVITITNRAASATSNAAQTIATNVQRLNITNLSTGTNQPIPIKLSPPK